MIGPILIAVALLVVIPVGVMMTGGLLAAGIGWIMKKDTDDRYEGTEHLEIS